MIFIISKEAKPVIGSIFILRSLHMENIKFLSDLYQLYVLKNLAKKDFEGLIFQYLLDNYEHFRVFNENQERWGDFLSWLYPRLTKSIDLYRDLGSSFDAYINGLVHSAAKEYRFREKDHSLTEYICWRARAEEMLLFESEPEYTENVKRVSLPGDVNPRQVLLLLLKSYSFVSDEYVSRVAKTIGMEAGAIQKMIWELRNKRSDKEFQISSLRDRLHCQHYRCLAYQKRMTYAQNGTVYYEKMKGRFERAKKRYNAMKKRLCGMRMAASNRMIAEVLGVPRGTVDSSLSAIKNRLSATGLPSGL